MRRGGFEPPADGLRRSAGGRAILPDPAAADPGVPTVLPLHARPDPSRRLARPGPRHRAATRLRFGHPRNADRGARYGPAEDLLRRGPSRRGRAHATRLQGVPPRRAGRGLLPNRKRSPKPRPGDLRRLERRIPGGLGSHHAAPQLPRSSGRTERWQILRPGHRPLDRPSSEPPDRQPAGGRQALGEDRSRACRSRRDCLPCNSQRHGLRVQAGGQLRYHPLWGVLIDQLWIR